MLTLQGTALTQFQLNAEMYTCGPKCQSFCYFTKNTNGNYYVKCPGL